MRKKLAIGACVLLGPVLIITGFYASYVDYQFARQAIEVPAKIINRAAVPGSRGSKKVRLRVLFTPPDSVDEKDGFLTVSEELATEVAARNPLLIRYRASDPERLRLADAKPKGWIPILQGLALSIAGYFGVRSWKAQALKSNPAKSKAV